MRSQEYTTTVRMRAFGYTFKVVFTKSIPATMKKYYKRLNMALPEGDDFDSYERTEGIHFCVPGQSVSYIMLEEDVGIAAAVHEAYHGICAMSRFLVTTFDEETFAYHLDHLTGKICQLHNKILDKRSKIEVSSS